MENIDNNAIAKNAISKILAEKGIKHIVYVDDNINKTLSREQFIGKLRSLYVKKPDYIDFVNWKLPIKAFETSIKQLWENASRVDIQKYTNVLTSNGTQEELDTHPILDIKAFFPEIVKEFTPEEWLIT